MAQNSGRQVHASLHRQVLGQFVVAAPIAVLKHGAVKRRVHGPSPTGRAVQAIRRDDRGGMSMRELERKRKEMWRTVRKALDSAWPEPGKKLAARATALDPHGR
ncbi:hypothetical protein [Streptomyces sp. NBC_00624]|uniref:hypothetical protein n=1 Tax=Streptomyces sp. NBC_00624 TaxID=2975791 RepID=UPI0030DFFCAC